MESALISKCRLCEAVSNPFRSGGLLPCDTPIHSSNQFVFMPSIGPLCVGHTMLVSRRHASSLLSMTTEERSCFSSDAQVIQNAWGEETLTFAEHGSACADGSGPCIAHTHVNVIPGLTETALGHTRIGGALIAAGELERLPKMESSYFLIGRREQWALYSSDHAPSQWIRQLLFEGFGLLHWDWRTSASESVILETLQTWQQRLTV